MSTRVGTIRAWAARLSKLERRTDPDVSLLGIMAGALHSLEKADQLGYQDARGQSRNLAFFASEFRRTLKSIGKGDQPPQRWLAGFYFISALVRLAALLDRLKLPLATRSRAHLMHDVDWFKHRDEDHPVSRMVTSWDEALKVANDTCSALESRITLRGRRVGHQHLTGVI
jgi:hypothetical protein